MLITLVATDNLLREIDEQVEEAIDRHARHQAEQKAQSRRTVYRKALREVQQIAGGTAARNLADWITRRIHQDGTLPTGRRVRKKGAEICRSAGYRVSTGSWLGA